MKTNPKHYANVLLRLAQSATKKEIPEIVDKFITLLVRERQFGSAKKIIEHVEEFVRQEEGRVQVTVTGAHVLDRSSKTQIAEFLRKEEETIDFVEEVDPGIIGGIKIKLHDLLIDATISGQLEKLRQQLT